jgi:hypothetical protein
MIAETTTLSPAEENTTAAIRLQDALYIAAHQNAKVVNYSDFARQLYVSRQVARQVVELMMNLGWIRLIPAAAGCRGRFRRPMLYFRSFRLLARIEGIRDISQLDRTPQGRRLAVCRAVEEIMTRELRINRRARFSYYGGYHSDPVDLILDLDGLRVGIYCVADFLPDCGAFTPVRRALCDGVIDRGVFLTNGSRACTVKRFTISVPTEIFVYRYEDWRSALHDRRTTRLMISWANAH